MSKKPDRKIAKQNYPALCDNCIRRDKRTELLDRKSIILFARGRNSGIKQEDIDKYQMEFDEKNQFYRCNTCKGLSASDISEKLFWNECSQCQTPGLNFESQEKWLQNVTYDRKLVGNELKTIPKVAFVQNEKQESVTCKNCGHTGKKFDEKEF